MKKIISAISIIFILLGINVVLQKISAGANERNERKIVVWKEDVSEEVKNKALASRNIPKIKNLKLVNATAVVLSDKSTEELLKKDPNILRIEDDILVEALDKKDFSLSLFNRVLRSSKSLTQPPQVLPWGVDKIDAEKVWPLGNTADPVKVGIIDTGISNKHPDLLPNIKDGVNTINPYKSWNDDNGHGSHVAGIVAALNNDIGVVGVGPQIDLYAIKVLNANGSGYLSDVIEGIEWAISNKMDIINLSLGTSADSQTLHDAISAAKNAGIVIVAAAGNNGGPVLYPAAYPEVIAVSATDESDNLASWSSRGPEIDLSAPGVSIYSTYKGTSYATLSGTSMAAPHVTGAAALVLNSPVGTYDFNSNGKWDPDEVKQKLQDTAKDLGTPGFDPLYGWGRVDAFSAATQ
jgi:subtilisin family serine protease